MAKRKLKLKEKSAATVAKDVSINKDELNPIELQIRLAALKRFCSNPSNLSTVEIKEILDEDYFE
ncbi:MAG: hypothetical protein V1773_07925 [bacterium]